MSGKPGVEVELWLCSTWGELCTAQYMERWKKFHPWHLFSFELGRGLPWSPVHSHLFYKWSPACTPLWLSMHLLVARTLSIFLSFSCSWYLITATFLSCCPWVQLWFCLIKQVIWLDSLSKRRAEDCTAAPEQRHWVVQPEPVSTSATGCPCIQDNHWRPPQWCQDVGF